MMRRSAPWGVAAAILGIVAFVLFLAWIALLTYGKVAFGDFLSMRTAVAANPGLSEGFVPQGLTWNPDEESFFTCGSMLDGSPSRIYAVTPATGEVRSFPLTRDGQPFYGQAGGLQYAGGFLYLADGKEGLYRFPSRLPASGEPLDIGGPIPLHGRASFVFAANGFVYVGEHGDGSGDGGRNAFSFQDSYHSSIIAKYRSGNFSSPVMVYSIGNDVRGMALLADGTIVLSQSQGISPSRLLLYSPSHQVMTGKTMHGAEVCFLGEPTRSLDAPPLLQDLDVCRGNLVYGSASASKRHWFGRLYFDTGIYSLRIQ